ncbi:hypothetical protein MNBD_UNCLBAC01-2109 [hydrothermal vent metagenome]|uniref:Thioredoxin-like fold domain-containing protein n=1 Tax=hydrothermal vent metagenome TaxID=652676 RepID=A0A3B1CWU8_9ZZZZ
MKSSKKNATIFIVIFVIAAVFGVKFFLSSKRNNQSSIIEARVKGDKKAPLQIVEFIDFQCPACAMGAKYLKEFMKENPSVVHLEMKYFPLKSKAYGVLSAQYVECASKQGKFWSFHDYLVDRQAQWRKLTDAKPAFELMAEELQLDKAQLDKCLVDEKTTEIIFKDKKEGQDLGIRSTPTYFVNGEMVVGPKNLKEKLEHYIKNN